MELMQISDIWDDVIADFKFMENRHYRSICPSQSLSERFRNIRHNYKIYQEAVGAVLGLWINQTII